MTYNSGQELNNNELRNEKELKETREGEVLSRDERLRIEKWSTYDHENINHKIWECGDKILPMLNGFTTSEIEKILKYVGDSIALYPIEIKF